jgi:hypothetical protein
MTWAALFERAAVHERTRSDVVSTLADRRDRDRDGDDVADEADNDGERPAYGTERADDPDARVARVVADADVLAADLLVGGAAREALDHVRRHSWVTLLASDALIADAAAVVADLADGSLAADWRAAVEALRTPVGHPAGDHPGLASAYRGDAGHLLTFVGDLRSVEANLGLQPHADLSVRSPASFARLFEPERLYPVVEGGEYSGPDRDPRA